MHKPTHKPTPEQQAIIEAARPCRESLMVTAYAGCAKTTTLEMIASALPQGPALALAFNVKIKKELEARFPGHFKIMTLNGLGHGAWQRVVGKALTLDDRKIGKCVTQVCKEAGFNATSEEWAAIRRLVSAAMQQGLVPAQFTEAKGLVPDHPDVWEDIAEDLYLNGAGERLVDLARKALALSIRQSFAGIVSFDDQIYMSTMFGGEFPRFARVMVDEAQDLSPLNHIQVARTAADWLAVVGDPKQAIYQFRGADSDSMRKLRALRSAWVDLPLATTFRCPKLIVSRQQRHAPGFTAWETNAEGEFRVLPNVGEVLRTTTEVPKWRWQDTAQGPGEDEIAVLCRNNAPLLSIAFKLIAGGIGVVMLGRDIGKGLVALSQKLAKDDATPIVQFRDALQDWREGEISKALANDKDAKLDTITDKADCLSAVIAGGAKTAGDLRRMLNDLFERQSGRVTLSTGHRAKGLEWDTVLHLDPWRIPSKYAVRHPVALEQEKNLKYVIETRAKRVLIEASLEEFEI